jgi:hypothetical protein
MVNVSFARGLVPGSGQAAVPGVLVVLACAPAVCPHVEFGVSAVLGQPVSLTWSEQPAATGALYAALEWRASPGTAGLLAGRLRGLGIVSFEAVEGPSPGCDSERYAFVPALGLHRAAIGANGDVVVGETALRALMARSDGADTLSRGLTQLLGSAWDDALEPLRQGAHGAPITWLRRTG